jgi:hypothetical protein
MFIPGCGCCGCKPCPYCSPDCLTATFSGFAHGTENCNECSFLDGTTFVLKRPPTNGRNHFLSVTAVDTDGPDEGESATGSGASFGQPGVTFNGTITNVARREDGSYYVTAVTINNGGSGYDTPTLTFTPTNFIECRKPTVSVTVTSGAITAVTVEEGGEYWLDSPCVYSGESCAVCPENAGQKLTARLTIGSASNTIEILLGVNVIVSATQSNTDEEDAPIPCDEFTFTAENVTGCTTNGTISIASGECSDSSTSACDLPEQISFSASGIPLIFGHSGAYGGAVSGAFVPDLAEHCGIDGYCTASVSVGGGLGGAANISLVARDESGVILEGGRGESCGIEYTGTMPDLPTGSVDNGFVWTSKNCGGSLSGGRAGILTISATEAFTNVSVSPPSWGTYGAEAEATVAGGAVTSITVTNPGEGYAREIFTRTEPDMDVTLSASAGTGAVLSSTLTQVGTGEEAYWYVSAVAVTNGGTGYTGAESVVFTPEAGATTQDPAYGYVVTGRTAPTVTATATGGSGASLSVTLTQSTDFNGLDVWGVSAVSVTSGGTGYTDGSEVTFTVTDGVAVYGASATITVGREEPTVTASVPAPSAGTGAALAVTLTASGTSWTVSGLSITNGGSGYSAGDSIAMATGDTEESGGYAIVDTVNGSGAITAVTIYSGGSYYRSTGVIESVSIGWGGEYFKSTGVITSVVIEYGGTYFVSTSTGTSEVDTPTVTIGSNAGEGATATATVDGVVSSATFGQITGISLTSGGSGYLSAVPLWQATLNYDGLAHASVSDRITTDPCPTSLLNRSYAMSLSINSLPGLFADGCGEPDEVTEANPTTNTYRWDGITITVAVA